MLTEANNQTQDARIAELERRVAELEQRLALAPNCYACRDAGWTFTNKGAAQVCPECKGGK